MGTRSIKAVVECDGCAKQFRVDLDAADDRPAGWTWDDLVADAVRGGTACEGTKGESLGVSSHQGNKMLCPICTKVVDNAFDENHTCTEAEVDAALNAHAGV